MCLNQDRGWKLRQMDSLMPTLNDPYRQGRMTWTEQTAAARRFERCSP
jgi:hypothetical protein